MPTIDQIKDGKHLYRCLGAYFAMYLTLYRCYILAFIDSNQEIEKELRGNVGEACNFTKINTPSWVFFTFFKLYKTCNFTKINTPPCVFFTFFKLYKWYQIAQRITYLEKYFDQFYTTGLFLYPLETSGGYRKSPMT